MLLSSPKRAAPCVHPGLDVDKLLGSFGLNLSFRFTLACLRCAEGMPGPRLLTEILHRHEMMGHLQSKALTRSLLPLTCNLANDENADGREYSDALPGLFGAFNDSTYIGSALKK